MKIPGRNLYEQMALWLVLNFLVLFGAAAGFETWTIFGSSTSLFPSYIFSGNIESEFRAISISLEYRPIAEWKGILDSFNRGPDVRYHLVSIDKIVPETMEILPEAVRRAVARIPRTPFTLCNTVDYASVYDLAGPFKNATDEKLSSVAAPSTPVLFLKTEGRYWFGRALLIPDDQDQTYYMFMAADSPNFFGSGLYFDIGLILSVAAIVLGISLLWWVPFFASLSRPLLRMSSFASGMAENEFRPSPGYPVDIPQKIAAERSDEIGRLAGALLTMSKRGDSLVSGQLQYIRHVAHEINTPLSQIRLGLAILEKRLDGDARRRVEKIIADVEQLGSLTDDVLDHLRSKASPAATRVERLAVMEFLRCALGEEIESRGLRLSGDASLCIRADRNALARIFTNLVRNARRYAGDEAAVSVSAADRGGGVEIRFEDNGPGVPPEEISSIMEPFCRGRNAALSHPGGSGLGLSIVRYSVESCSGTVRCENAVPHGLAVIMMFPKCTGPAPRRQDSDTTR